MRLPEAEKRAVKTLRRNVVGTGYHDGKQISQRREAGSVQRRRRNLRAIGSDQVAGGGGTGHDRGTIPQIESTTGRGIDAHVGHESSQDQILDRTLTQQRIKSVPTKELG